jgi:hypothetical protein
MYDSVSDRWEILAAPWGEGIHIADMKVSPTGLWLALDGWSENGVACWNRLTRSWKLYPVSEGFISPRAISLALDGRYVWVNGISVLTRLDAMGSTLWEKNVPVTGGPVSLEELVPPFQAAGRFVLESDFSSPASGFRRETASAFYVVPGNAVLTMETDKRIYRAGETVLLNGRLENRGLLEESGTLKVSRDGQVFSEQAVTLASGEGLDVQASFTATETERVTATFDDVTVEQDVVVETPSIRLTLAGPDAAGLEPFTLSLLLENPGRVPAEGTVAFGGESFPVSLAPGESSIIDKDFTLTQETTFQAGVAGGASVQKTVRLGPGAVLTARPDAAYAPGAVVVPFSLANGGVMPLQMDVHLSLNGSTVRRRLAVPAGGVVEDAAVWEGVPEGVFVMTYDSLLARGSAAVLVAKRDVARVEDLAAWVVSGPSPAVRVTGRVINAGANAFEGTWRLEAPFAADEGPLSLAVGESLPFDRLLPLTAAAAGLHAVRLEALRGGNVAGEDSAQVSVAPVWRVSASASGPWTAGGEGTVSLSVSNDGTVGGLARAEASLGETLDDERTLWVEPGETRSFSLAFTLPEDLEEKTYAGLARVTDDTGGAPAEARFEAAVAGYKVDSSAAWAVDSSVPGEAARLTVTAHSLNALSPQVFFKVQSDFFESAALPVALGTAPVTSVFDMTAPPGDWSARTVTYGVYAAATGRALRLDTVYLYRRSAALPVSLSRFLFAPGEAFSATVRPPSDGVLRAVVPGGAWEGSVLAGVPETLTLPLPGEMVAGTYRLSLEFTPAGSTETVTASYPFDVAGYRVTVKDARPAAPDPAAGSTTTFLFRVDASQALAPVTLRGVLDGTALFVSTLALSAGESVYAVSAALPEESSGPIRLHYSVEKSSLVLAAGSVALDVRRPGALPVWAEVAVQVSTGPLAGVVPMSASVTEGVDVARVDFLVDGVLAAAVPGGQLPYRWDWDTAGVADGTHTLSTVVYDRTGGAGTAWAAALVLNAAAGPSGGPSGGLPPLVVKDVYVYPNPVRAGKVPKVRVDGSEAAGWSVRIYDAAGGLVHEASPSAGPSALRGENGYEYVWDDAGSSPGVYVCVVEVLGADGSKATRTTRFSLIR